MGRPIVQVDAFASEAFRGNPAAVCVLPEAAAEAWMGSVAREMNLSETAFVVPRGNGDFDLRWFTPAAEVDLCGHATLASAHVLWSEGHLAPGREARFHTRSGLLTARQDGEWIEMDFPAEAPTEATPPEGLLPVLGLDPHAVTWTGRNRMDWLVVLDSRDEVRAVEPDFGRLRRVQARGVIVSAPGDGEHDFVSRFFAPAVGVDEDPVTGSAHCCLTPYWADRLGRDTMRAWQDSARGGEVKVRLVGDRVRLAGRAVTVLRGELL